MLKIQKNTKPQDVVSHVTESTDREETKKRQGEARRMAEGRPKWSLSGRRIDGKKEDKE